MDKIENIVELCPNALHRVTYSPQKAEFVLRCEARCLELSKVVLGTNDRIPHQHIETLVTGMHPNRSVYDIAQAVQDYHSMRAILQEVIAQNGASHSVSQDQKRLVSAQKYAGAMSVSWVGSSFFSTEGGRIGIGPESMKTGDSICIFFGAHVPHILQFDSVRKIHLLVRSAFVSDLMDATEFYAKDPCNTYKALW